MNHKINRKNYNPTMDDNYLSSASAYDCTGLIPSLPLDDTEVENYEELYPYLPPETLAVEHKTRSNDKC